MKLDIECLYCDFKITADWPELWPGHLDHLVVSLLDSDDEGLKRISLHHAATRPEIAGKRGLVAGHGSYKYRINGESNTEWHRGIEVSGNAALLK
jgi:hypothetical protein